jgi:hypothetical protein
LKALYDFFGQRLKIASMAIKKILILAANPLDTDRLRLDKEVEEIRTTLQLKITVKCAFPKQSA